MGASGDFTVAMWPLCATMCPVAPRGGPPTVFTKKLWPHIWAATVPWACLTTSLLTNPLDLLRARVQVQRLSIPETVRLLWQAEGRGVFSKGLTARMTSSCIYSLAVIFGYETVKKMAVLPQYRESVLW